MTVHQSNRAHGIQTVALTAPLRWLALGWADLLRCPLPGLLHGLVAALFGAALVWLARDRFWFLAGAFSGFLLVAPLIATGLYAVSRSLERGEKPGIGTALAAWVPKDSRLVRFGLLLALAGTGWVLTSAALITRFAPAPILGIAHHRVCVGTGAEPGRLLAHRGPGQGQQPSL